MLHIKTFWESELSLDDLEIYFHIFESYFGFYAVLILKIVLIIIYYSFDNIKRTMSALISIRYFQNSTYHLTNPADTMKVYKNKMLIFQTLLLCKLHSCDIINLIEVGLIKFLLLNATFFSFSVKGSWKKLIFKEENNS